MRQPVRLPAPLEQAQPTAGLRFFLRALDAGPVENDELLERQGGS